MHISDHGPASNKKNKRGILRTIVVKIYIKLSLPISIQNVNEFEPIETKVLEARISI